MTVARWRQERYLPGMRPEFLGLSDRALAERMHLLEAQSADDDAAFEHFRRLRTNLSREAWQSLTDELDCDRGPLAEVGVMVFPLDEDFARRLLQALLASPRIKMRRKNFAPGYVSTSFAQCDYLNSSNHYRKLTPASLALLAEFLSTAGPMAEAAIGHPFRIASTRQFQLVPNRFRALREAHRVLRSGGTLAYVSWLADERAFGPDADFDAALEEIGIGARDLDDRPGDVESVAAAVAQMRRAGFSRVTAEAGLLEHPFDVEGYDGFMTTFDEEDLVRSLEPDERDSLLAGLRRRLRARPAADLVLRLSTVTARGTRP